MSQSTLEPSPSARVLDAEARALALAERAMRSLGRSREGVLALKQVLEQLCTLAGTFERVSFRLSALGASASAAADRPSAMEFLVDVARRTSGAIRELEASMRLSVSAADRLIEQADDGRRALADLIPAVRELGAAARAGAPTTPTVEVVVRRSQRNEGGDSAEQKIASFLRSIWPAPAGGSGSKN